jgi:ABC-type branched-subunit amino acid transport system substrate-binding protein
MRRSIRWCAPLLAVLLIAAACGDDDDDSGAPTDTSALAGTDTTAAGATATTAAGGATATTAVATSAAKTILGSGIPSGDACPKTALTGVPGVSDTEIKIGGIVGVTNPVGNPYSDSPKGLLAYIKGVNDAGGVCGRQLKYVETIDDQTATSRNLLAARQLVEQDEVFAVAPVMTQSFGGAKYLVENNVPTFGWNIQVEWTTGENLFAEKGSGICFQPVNAPTCPTGLWTYVASNVLKATKVASLSYGSSPQSASCGDAQEVSYQTFPSPGVTFDFKDQSLSFGFTPEALGPTIDKIKADGVDMVITCFDLNANLRVLTAMQDAGLTTSMYWPNGYDQNAIDEFGPQIKNKVYTGVEFRPFEVKQSPGMEAYQNSMKANGLPLSEYTLTGWINADLLVTGIRAAAQDDGKFDRKSVVDSINALPTYSAGGIVPGYIWAKDHGTKGSTACTAFLRVDGANKKYVSDTPDTPWTCMNPDTSDPATAELKSFGDEDTGLSTEGVQGTETAEEGGATAAQPADPAKATADVEALVQKYLAAQTVDERLAITANGESIREQATKAFRAGLQLEPLNIKVKFTSPTTADVAFGIKLNGNELKGITSTAYVVNVNGTWLYHPYAVCDGITQGGDAAGGAACLAAAKVP